MIENVLELGEVIRRRAAKRFVRFKNLLLLFVAFPFMMCEPIAGRRGRAVGVDGEELIKPKTRKQVTTAFAAAHHLQMPLAQFFQSQRDARHCPHEGRVHHGALIKINDELAVATVYHLARKLLQLAAVQEVPLAFHFHPDSVAFHTSLYR